MEIVFLMDRFGYCRTIDVPTFERNRDAALSENRYIIQCMNTDKLCLFTDAGRMHMIKVSSLPYGKFRDKAIPIDNFGNYNSSEESPCLCGKFKPGHSKSSPLCHRSGHVQAGKW